MGGADDRNARVVAARCKGWPIAELNLIPLDGAEAAANQKLVDRGISCVAASDPAWVSSPRLSAASSSLPDRDALDEYAAWCVEAQRRCLHGQRASFGSGGGSGMETGRACEGLAAC